MLSITYPCLSSAQLYFHSLCCCFSLMDIDTWPSIFALSNCISDIYLNPHLMLMLLKPFNVISFWFYFSPCVISLWNFIKQTTTSNVQEMLFLVYLCEVLVYASYRNSEILQTVALWKSCLTMSSVIGVFFSVCIRVCCCNPLKGTLVGHALCFDQQNLPANASVSPRLPSTSAKVTAVFVLPPLLHPTGL